MKILHVIPAVAARYGGPSTAVVSMCRALAIQRVDTLIATTDADGPGRIDLSIGQPTMWQGVPAIAFKRDFSDAYKYSRGLAQWAGRHVREFDVVHIHAVFSHASVAAASACRRAQVPYVVRPLGTLAPWSLQQKPARKRLMRTLMVNRMLDGAAAIHCTSDAERRAIDELRLAARAVVIPLGIDHDWLDEPLVAAAERQRDPYVLVVSRLHPKKNLEPLIESFVDISRASGTRWRLVLAGSGEAVYVAELERLVHASNAGDRVTFTGWVDGERKRELVRRASLFALVSMHENFGVSLLEALAAGVPGLVSRPVDLAEAVEKANAGWVVETSRSSLTAGLADAIAHPEERDARGWAARTLAREFTWPGIARQLHELYGELAKPLSTLTSASMR